MAPKRRSKDEAPRIELFVRRGALRRFDRLKRETAELPVVVRWDRRTSDGGPPAVERRQAEPFTWTAADFVVAEPANGRGASRARRSRRAAEEPESRRVPGEPTSRAPRTRG